MATCSGKGTLVRLWDTEKAELLQEVRRGTVTAVITDLTIDRSNKMLACASDQGTIHMFKIGQENATSKFASLGGLSSYFGS